MTFLNITNLFDIINKFKNIEQIDLVELDTLEEIPASIFSSLDQLHSLLIACPSLKKLGEMAFFNLKHLKSLIIIGTSIEKIGENILVFNTTPTEGQDNLDIILFDNFKLTCNSFQPGTFSKLQGVTLDFSGHTVNLSSDNKKQLTCMSRKVFLPFLEANPNNKVTLDGQQFDCTDCKSAWLQNSPQFQERLINVKCKNGKPLNDPDNFYQC